MAAPPDPLAQAVMVAYCGWDPTMLVTDQTVLLDGNGSTVLFLPCLNVTDVSAVTLTDGRAETTARTVAPLATPTVGTADPTDVGWAANGALYWTNLCDYSGWPIGQRNVAVTYSGGYDGPPDDLDAALNHLSARMPQVTGATSQRLGTAAVTWAQNVAQGGLLLVEQMVFDKYRLPRAA